ncbi:STAS domain-containing protein [Methanococcoides sp. SA1]|nr:STAS domain-containing protein [Methanococcoides sp. SA1]
MRIRDIKNNYKVTERHPGEKEICMMQKESLYGGVVDFVSGLSAGDSYVLDIRGVERVDSSFLATVIELKKMNRKADLKMGIRGNRKVLDSFLDVAKLNGFNKNARLVRRSY